MAQDHNVKKRKRNQHDCSPSWNNRLRELASLLPISHPTNGRGLTKKGTLLHLLQYFDFLQSHIERLENRLPYHCLSEIRERESESESEESSPSEPAVLPHFLKAQHKNIRGCSRKRTTINTDSQGRRPSNKTSRGQDPVLEVVMVEEDREFVPLWARPSYMSEHQYSTPTGACVEDDTTSLPSSSMSNSSLSQLLLMSTTSGVSSEDQMSPSQEPRLPRSACEYQTEIPDTPPAGFSVLPLKDPELGDFPSRGESDLPSSPVSVARLSHLAPLRKEDLHLSPSLLTSPTHGLSYPFLPEGQDELQALFEDVCKNASENIPDVPGFSDSLLEDWSSERATVAQHHSAPYMSSQSEAEDVRLEDTTWTPKKRAPMKKSGQACLRKWSSAKASADPPSPKKKCINGFIMFCRMNRRLYLRAHPGTPSTVVTKELANLWHIMPKQERRVYCLKARRLSRQQNRNVRSKAADAETEAEVERCVPSPLHLLLIRRDLRAAARESSQRDTSALP